MRPRRGWEMTAGQPAFATVFRVSTLLKLRMHERRSPESISRLQERKLIALVRHAYDRVPFYRRLFESANIEPADVRSLDDLKRLPIVSKDDLLAQPPGDTLAGGVDPDRCARSSSSGTSGAPLTVLSLPRDKSTMNLVWARAYLANGMRPWHRLVAFTGQRPRARRTRWHEKAGFFRRGRFPPGSALKSGSRRSQPGGRRSSRAMP